MLGRCLRICAHCYASRIDSDIVETRAVLGIYPCYSERATCVDVDARCNGRKPLKRSVTSRIPQNDNPEAAQVEHRRDGGREGHGWDEALKQGDCKSRTGSSGGGTAGGRRKLANYLLAILQTAV